MVGDVAHHARPQFDDADRRRRSASFKQQGQTFPKQGTTDYETIKSQALTLLVQQAEREEKADVAGHRVTDKQTSRRASTQIKKQYFGGSEKKYQAQLKKQGLTDAQVRDDIRAQLISEAVFKKVTSDVEGRATPTCTTTTSRTRSSTRSRSRATCATSSSRTKALADSIYTQLKGGDRLRARSRRSTRRTRARQDTGGKLTVSKGQTVAAVRQGRVLAARRTSLASRSTTTQYGWFVIQPLARVKPRRTTPEKQVAEHDQAAAAADRRRTRR